VLIRTGSIGLWRASPADVPAIVGLLADDYLGKSREATEPGDDLEPYQRAFEAIMPTPPSCLW
jgi:hypothetical protein